MKKIFFALYFIILFFFSVSKASAVSVNISNYPSSISSDPFILDVSISGASQGQNFLRIDLFKEGSSNYFGETYNGSEWYMGSDGKKYFPAVVNASKSASATIQARVGSPKANEYSGPGFYKLRVRRYTSSGNQASSDTQELVNIYVNLVLPSPTFTPAPTSKASSTPKSTTTPTKTLTRETISENNFEDKSASEFLEDTYEAKDLVLGDTTSSSEKKEKNIKEKKDTEVLGQSTSKIPIFIFVGGLIFIGCAILAFLFLRFKRSRHGQN